jgi:hypothetical protein
MSDQSATEFKFRVEGVEYDISDLTWDEVEQIEEQFDSAFAELDFGRSKVMRAIVLALIRHTRPDATAEELGKVKILKSMVVENGAGPDS